MKIFEITVKYDSLSDEGFIKQLTEKHLVKGYTFTDAEAETTAGLKPFCIGEFEVTAIRMTKAVDIFESNILEAYKWYKCSVNFISFDENTGKEKKTNHVFYIQSSSVEAANEGLKIELKDTISDYDIKSVDETKIISFIK